MNTIPRQKLCELIVQYGVQLCDNPQRCRAFLMDVCPEYQREIRVLVTVLENNLFSRLLNSTTHVPYVVTRDLLIKDLYENHGTAREFAEWAVESWAIALGITTEQTAQSPVPSATGRASNPQPQAGYTFPNSYQLTSTPAYAPSISPTQQQTGATATSSGTPKRHTALILVLVTVFLAISLLATAGINHTIESNNATATAISIDNDNATATVQAYATATASVVAANPDPYSPAGTLALLDPLKRADNWPTYSDTSFGSQCQYTAGSYQVSQSPSLKFSDCTTHTIYDNFTFEVAMTITQGDCGGITMRSESNSAHLYWFKLCQDGRYTFYKYTTNSNAIVKIGGTTSQARTGTGETNSIAVVANNGSFDLYVNGQKIDSVTDTDYSHFRVGLVANAEANDTTVSYQNARLWTI